ncbi:hypothetical protein P280DRAFT_534158 [Massarina eburnea CBS 473.64]|uniref:Uncharacterized protein n=1 Tax=Massarina eburnea CBS 473.64 TaxID=1395130 RepID=A0A6A6RNX8_9PLEO|nr:hypothetical protein P280DRAFT_534158 [Massarina eburnea CBS 473.64]
MAPVNLDTPAPKQATSSKDIQTKIPFKVTKLNTQTKRKTNFGKKYLQALQRPKAPINKRYAVKIETNGLVSMDSAPDYLVPATKRNEKESSLLRLPENIRKKIWVYAMGGLSVEIRLRKTEDSSTDATMTEATAKSENTSVKPVDEPVSTPLPKAEFVANTNDRSTSDSPQECLSPKIDSPVVGISSTESTPTKAKKGLKPKPKTRPQSDSPYYATVVGSGPGRKKIHTAFHLPSVCRQIYKETATLGYALNQFFFVGEIATAFMEDGPDGALEGWGVERIPAQLQAITTIRPHWMDMIVYLQKNNMRAFKHFYPSLTRIVVPKRALNFEAGWPERWDPMREVHREKARKTIMASVKAQEGEHVEVVF